MTAGRKDSGGADSEEHDSEEVLKIPELTEEAEERIFAKIKASIVEIKDELEVSEEE